MAGAGRTEMGTNWVFIVFLILILLILGLSWL